MKPTIKCINGRWIVSYQPKYCNKISQVSWDEWKWAIYYLNELYEKEILELNGSTL